jgi:flagellar basal body-associated protein FliL
VKIGKKTILLVGLPVGLSVAGGIGFMVMSGGSAVIPPVPDPGDGQHGIMLPLEDRVVNLLTGPEGSFRYVKLGVTVEIRPAAADFYKLEGEARVLAEELAAEEYKAAEPLLFDAIGRVVSARESEQIGPAEARIELKHELLEAFRSVLGEEEVIDLYFTDLVMQ